MSTSASEAISQFFYRAVSCEPLDPFTGEEGRDPYSVLPNGAFDHVLDFLAPKDLIQAELVCRSWDQFIDTKDQWQWKKQCQNRLNIPDSMDPMKFLPQGCDSYKKGIRLASTKVYDARSYRRILGAEIELVSPTLEAISLEKGNEPDPCDPTKTKGQEYVWLDSPSYFKISVDGDFPFELDKLDDPNDEEAPRLIQKEVGLVESFARMIGLGSKSGKRVLKVPNTINNLGILFNTHPKYQEPSAYYEYSEKEVFNQHGNKRIPQGRICMRKDVIGRNLTFAQQRAAATEAGVVIPQLGHRILFDFLRCAESNGTLRTFARTSTLTVLTVAGRRVVHGSICGGDGLSCGLHAGVSYCGRIVYHLIGAAVALPDDRGG